MKRPDLNRIDHGKVDLLAPGNIVITMSSGQWDALLEELYNEGAFLVELDDNENMIALYRKAFN